MTPAQILRSQETRNREIRAKEDAIKRRLQRSNDNNKKSAQKSAAALANKAKGTGKTFTKSYTTQKILGADKGFTKSDYGVGAGAAIPYQIGDSKSTVAIKATGGKPKPKPTASQSVGKAKTAAGKAWANAREDAIKKRLNK
jgi:hypothetical protein